MWEFTGKRSVTREDGTTVQVESGPIVGIGAGPFEDAEFEALVTAYDAQYDEPGSVQASGLYARSDAKPAHAVVAPAAETDANEEAPE